MPTISVPVPTAVLDALDAAKAEALISDLKAQNPGRQLLQFSTRSGAVILRVPNLEQAAQLERDLKDRSTAGLASENLLRACIVHPAKKKLDELLAHKPVLIDVWYRQLRKEMGEDDKVEVSEVDDANLAAANPGRELKRLKTPTASLVVRVPSLSETREVRARGKDPARKDSAAEWLTRSSILLPDRDGLNAILDARPLLLDNLFEAVMNLAGADEELTVGKL